MPTTVGASVGARTNITNVLDFPDEILGKICGECTQSDWICLSLVCKRFRDFAAARLYRDFNIVFPDEDDPFFDAPVDGLAGGLQTFASSNYNYAKHLREIKLDTISVGQKAEAAYKPYLATVTCGKFMNTLFLLTLRKAKSLDTFRWNIRVELGSPIYQSLHEIKSLRRLHLRLQAGPSVYDNPPPLPLSDAQYPQYAATASGMQFVHPGDGPPPLPPASSTSKSSWKTRTSKKATLTQEPRTIAGFRNLESLSVLDMDSLDIVPQITTCVRNSSSTLRELQLSFSFALAMQSRRPVAELEMDESEDDDFQADPLITTANYDNNGPARIFRAQEERKAQELVLGRIFEVEPSKPKNCDPPTEEKAEEQTEEKISTSQYGQQFIYDVTHAFTRMMMHVNGISDFGHLDQQDALDTITEAAKKYVESEKSKIMPSSSTQAGSNDDDLRQAQLPDGEELSDQRPKAKSVTFAAEPEDLIDISDPEELPTADPQSNVDTGMADIMADITSSENLADEPEAEESFYSATSSGDSDLVRISNARQKLDRILADMEKYVAEKLGEGNLGQNASQYLRETRGIGLHSLSLHLIPIKASVLSKAVDLHTLERITLLNVGEQRKFWTMMMMENKQKRLPLRKVFTDDVCLQFLQLVSELDCVTEVLLLQRSPKYNPQSFAPRPTTTIGQIRKMILKKHMGSIQRLMIKNQADDSWDIDDRAMRIICGKGHELQELAVIMGMQEIHTLIQNIHLVPNLRALQIITFRSEDTCLSVMRETRRFIVDALSHCVGPKLEWLAMGEEERAVRIVERPEVPKLGSSAKGKGPATATGPIGDHTTGTQFPVAPMTWDDESDSEEEDQTLLSGFTLEMIEGFTFYDISDIYGIRIFEKEVVNGCL
ncbi:hypothetical protein GGR54DRAFT_412669 [Hypoxylon sp. NC1633]|nr:hypothetical protein GGR54DRAFT_412669 [Hypoxylon sp. NC1633]